MCTAGAAPANTLKPTPSRPHANSPRRHPTANGIGRNNGRVADTWSAPEQIAACSHFGAIHIVMSSTDVAKHILRDAASARLRAAIGTTEVCCHRAALKAFDRAIGEEAK